MSKLRRRAMRHFVMLIEIHMHLIRVNPGHICFVGANQGIMGCVWFIYRKRSFVIGWCLVKSKTTE